MGIVIALTKEEMVSIKGCGACKMLSTVSAECWLLSLVPVLFLGSLPALVTAWLSVLG